MPIRRIVAEQNVHQRGFASTVLTEQREDLTLLQGQADVVIGVEFAEAFTDSAYFKHRLGSGCRA